jgi:hypothetical protein
MVARPPEELDRHVRGEEERWRKVIQDAGIRIEWLLRPAAERSSPSGRPSISQKRITFLSATLQQRSIRLGTQRFGP